jgi:hypothetical protein
MALNTQFYKQPPALDQISLADRLKATMVNPFPPSLDPSKQPVLNTDAVSPSVGSSSVTSPVTAQSQQQQPNPNIDHDTHDEINSIIDNPLKTAVAMRLQNLLSNYPTPDQYQPSNKRRVLGSIAGGLVGATQGAEAGGKIAKETLDAPYKRALDQWNAQEKPTEAAYKMNVEATKAGFSNLKDYQDYLHSRGLDDPSLQGRLESAKSTADVAARLPGQIKLEDMRQTGDNERNILTNSTSSSNNKRTVASANARTAADIEGRSDVAKMDIVARASEGKLNRDSREGIARRELEMRKELDKGNKLQRVPIDQQVKARFEAEDSILGSKSGDPKLPAVTADELRGIGQPILDSKGSPTGVYMLKPKANVDPKYIRAWEIRKEQAEARASELLSTNFSGKTGGIGTADNENAPAVDDEWTGGKVGQ